MSIPCEKGYLPAYVPRTRNRGRLAKHTKWSGGEGAVVGIRRYSIDRSVRRERGREGAGYLNPTFPPLHPDSFFARARLPCPCLNLASRLSVALRYLGSPSPCQEAMQRWPFDQRNGATAHITRGASASPILANRMPAAACSTVQRAGPIKVPKRPESRNSEQTSRPRRPSPRSWSPRAELDDEVKAHPPGVFHCSSPASWLNSL